MKKRIVIHTFIKVKEFATGQLLRVSLGNFEWAEKVKIFCNESRLCEAAQFHLDAYRAIPFGERNFLKENPKTTKSKSADKISYYWKRNSS